MKKRKTRFNILDFLLIVAVAALIVGIMWRQELSDKIEIRDSENTVTVLCEFGIVTSDSEVGTARFADGSTDVYRNDVAVGTVEKTTVVNSNATSDEASGEQENEPATVEEMHLKLSVVAKDSGYYLPDGEKLFIGGEYRLHTKTREFTVRIDSVVAE